MEQTKIKRIASIIFLVIGIVAIVFGILMLTADISWSHGSYERDKTYGGDAYTGIQNAAATTANNVIAVAGNLIDIGKILSNGFAYILISMGLFSIAKGLIHLFSSLKPKKKENATISTESLL